MVDLELLWAVKFVYNEELSNWTYCTWQLEVVMAKKTKKQKKSHSRPATANTETARNGRENVGIKVEFGFYYKRKKK